jgi:hypothetical protein
MICRGFVEAAPLDDDTVRRKVCQPAFVEGGGVSGPPKGNLDRPSIHRSQISVRSPYAAEE